MKSSTLLIMVTALSLGFSSRASKVPMKTSKTEVQKGSAPFIPQDKQWEDFKKLYKKVYATSVVERKYAQYRMNSEFVMNHNKGKHSYTLKVNEFADIDLSKLSSSGCFKDIQTISCSSKSKDVTSSFNKVPSNLRMKCPTIKNANDDSCDWHLAAGVVSPVRDQGRCGSCWAFSVISVVESWNALTSKRKVNLSPQHLVNCIPNYCTNGNPKDALKWINENLIASEEHFPYKEDQGNCPKTNSLFHKHEFIIEGVKIGNEEDLKYVIQNYGPVSAAIKTNLQTFKLYSSGIYDDMKCLDEPDHAVTIVGYGHDANTNKRYWIIKNSWGDDWGEQGYIRIVRGQNICGIACHGLYIRSPDPMKVSSIKGGNVSNPKQGNKPGGRPFFNAGRRLESTFNINHFLLLVFIRYFL